jgi:tRNA A22 N-methylase
VALKYFKQEIVNETVPEEKTKMYNLLTLESPNRRLRRSKKV